MCLYLKWGLRYRLGKGGKAISPCFLSVDVSAIFAVGRARRAILRGCTEGYTLGNAPMVGQLPEISRFPPEIGSPS